MVNLLRGEKCLEKENANGNNKFPCTAWREIVGVIFKIFDSVTV